jgi:hypothetical protein
MAQASRENQQKIIANEKKIRHRATSSPSARLPAAVRS